MAVKVSRLRVIVSVSLWLVVMSGITAFYFWTWLHRDHGIDEANRYFVIEKGESLYSVGQRLHEQHMLRWPRVWRLYSRLVQPGSVKVGEYNFAERESPVSMLRRLQSGAVITYSVTLVEGKTFAEWVQMLSLQPKLQVTLGGRPLEEQLALLDLGLDHPEGWFYPDTYRFVAGDSDVGLLRRAHQLMRQALEREWSTRAPDLPYASPYEALIMASIIEKETGLASERGDIAGVFVRRLRAGMRLQTDPTVIYGLGSDFSGNLTRAHLRTASPYNTYVISGLPPTPIAMPGGAAVHAAMHPADGTTLYFVAKGDGSHHFSSTLEEHNRAVHQYQRSNRRSDYRSSPSVNSGAAP
jgi:UPF0755 protein